MKPVSQQFCQVLKALEHGSAEQASSWQWPAHVRRASQAREGWDRTGPGRWRSINAQAAWGCFAASGDVGKSSKERACFAPTSSSHPRASMSKASAYGNRAHIPLWHLRPNLRQGSKKNVDFHTILKFTCSSKGSMFFHGVWIGVSLGAGRLAPPPYFA